MRSTRTGIDRIIPLDSERATLSLAGGKAANLSKLLRAGFSVPRGFILTTVAYDAFIAANRLAGAIAAQTRRIESHGDSEPALLDEASAAIVALFRSAALGEELARDLEEAYSALGSTPVAVRSSATAEDLPDMSFAGQQETFLNVIGAGQLREAVAACWASLWSARAIGYRARNGMAGEPVSLAVIVQRMVQSETAGVMFTANPVSGLRTQTVIEAATGLGEALVSGRVEPDRFTVDRRTGRIVERSVGEKELSIRSRPRGGTMSVSGGGDRQAGSALEDGEVLELAALGSRVEALFEGPQDIEWAAEDGKLHLLQARPVTSLFPVPAGMQPEPLRVMFSFATVQGLMDPLTPFGADMLRELFAAASRIFGYHRSRETQRVIRTAGGRLWVDFTPVLRNSVGRKVAQNLLGYVEPTVKQALRPLLDDPRLLPEHRGIRPVSLLRLARFFGPVAGNVLRNFVAPHSRRRCIVEHAEQLLDRLSGTAPAPGLGPRERLGKLVKDVEQLFRTEVPPTFLRLVAGVAAGMASLSRLDAASGKAAHRESEGGLGELALDITRGTPHNPTIEMDLSLWQVAKEVRGDAGTRELFDREASAELAGRFAAGRLPARVQTSIASFLARYGARGLAEIDSGRARWSEEPEHVFEIIHGYLQITDPKRSPDALYAASAARAQAAVERIESAARREGRWLVGRLRAAAVRRAGACAREFLGFREYPKFFAVRMMGLFRERLRQIGAELARSGEIARADDLFSLTLSEQRAFASGDLPAPQLRDLVDRRRDEFRRELLRRQIPRLLLSDGRAFYDGMEPPPSDRSLTGGEQLVGSPVSPGSVEGVVRVVLDPRNTHLRPGEIMVCRGTDPSWTPLFLIASGLVMEVGGMMTHGAVVAREYGLPAVVGVHDATTRLRSGQRVRLNGGSGLIALLDEAQPSAE